jgi:hypothetical protein
LDLVTVFQKVSGFMEHYNLIAKGKQAPRHEDLGAI